jgi:signal transduction histidine kinase
MVAVRRKLYEYGVALLAVAGAILLRWLLTPAFGFRVPFVTVMGAVAVAVGVGGLYPALLATVLGYVLARWFFVEPTHTLAMQGPADWIILAGYCLASGTVIAFGVLMRRANRRYRAIAAELAARNRQKDELLATVAHEIRGPLAPIRSAVEVMRVENAAPHHVRQAREVIDRQLDNITRLIDDLTDAGRIGRRQLELHRTQVPLAGVLEGAADAVRPILIGRHQMLALEVPPEPLLLDADGTRLEQVFVNLLTNASKFSPRQGRIEVKAAARDREVHVHVTDGGVGIAPEALPHIFELFYRGEHEQRGLGIGLALVRQLVTLHGGSVEAHSDGHGKGCVFLVRLPLSADQGAPREARQGQEELSRG